jgi:glutamate synthase (NADPH/NADH) small chain
VRKAKGDSVGIGRLERFVADWHREHSRTEPEKAEANGHKVAVIGAGPAGLTCAGDLARLGYEATIFEALHMPGGVLMYGIPEFRLPKAIVDYEINTLISLGVTIETNVAVGKTITIAELFERGFEAVFIGSGAGLPSFMHIPGESLNGVYSANEYLTRINLMKAYDERSSTPIQRSKTVAVVGGGNVAMDAARCAKRLGRKPYISSTGAAVTSCLRAWKRWSMPKRKALFLNYSAIRRRLSETIRAGCEACNVSGWSWARRTAAAGADGSQAGQRISAGCGYRHHGHRHQPEPAAAENDKGLGNQQVGCLVTRNDDGLTSLDRVYAGGDAVTGAATVILAMGAGKKAALAIHRDIMGNT